jgi:hypothetical protein
MIYLNVSEYALLMNVNVHNPRAQEDCDQINEIVPFPLDTDPHRTSTLSVPMGRESSEDTHRIGAPEPKKTHRWSNLH